MFLLVTGQYRRRCVHIGRAAACALALGCVSGAPFAQSDEGRGTGQPVTKPGECGDGKKAKVIACLQSDRRVGIEVAGTRALTNWMAGIRPEMIVNQLVEKQMNWDQIESDWKQFRGSARQQWGTLSDDHLDMIAGKGDQLACKIQETYGIAEDQAEKQLSDWQGRQKEMAQPK